MIVIVTVIVTVAVAVTVTVTVTSDFDRAVKSLCTHYLYTHIHIFTYYR